MARTAAPVTPGADTATSEEGKVDAPAAQPTIEALQAEVAQMRAMMGQMVRQQQSTLPVQVKLPSMAEVLKAGKPESPVLTSDGWYVPAILPQQRQAG
jgi:hypothetical protein